jgi:hypothetical protein
MGEKVTLFKKLPPFLKKHNHMLSFIGALIVFATFVVKEGLREKFKDVASATSEESYKYELRQQIHIIRDLLEQPSLGTKSKAGQVFGVGDVYLGRYISTGNEIQLLGDLNGALPENEAEAERLNSLKRSLATHPGTFVYDLQRQSAPANQIQDAQKELDDVEGLVYSEKNRLTEIAGTDRDKAKARYDAATIASYFLYTLGWGLGLVGRLLKVEGLAGGD